MRRGIVVEFDDAWMALEHGLHDAALDSTAPAVNHAHLAKSRGCGGVDVLGDYRGNVARSETVKIELGTDGNVDREVAHVLAVSFQLSAVSSAFSYRL